MVKWKEILNDFGMLHVIKLPIFVGNDKFRLLVFSDGSGNVSVTAIFVLMEIQTLNSCPQNQE